MRWFPQHAIEVRLSDRSKSRLVAAGELVGLLAFTCLVAAMVAALFVVGALSIGALPTR